MGNWSCERLNPYAGENELSADVCCGAVEVSFDRGSAFISVALPKRRKGLWPSIMLLLHCANFQVLTATLSTTSDALHLHYIHTQIPDETSIDRDTLQALLQHLILRELNGQPACRSAP